VVSKAQGLSRRHQAGSGRGALAGGLPAKAGADRALRVSGKAAASAYARRGRGAGAGARLVADKWGRRGCCGAGLSGARVALPTGAGGRVRWAVDERPGARYADDPHRPGRGLLVPIVEAAEILMDGDHEAILTHRRSLQEW